MSVLGDCNSKFDTRVRLTAALKARLPGIVQNNPDADAMPITLICGTENLADMQSFVCSSESPHCSCSDSGSCGVHDDLTTMGSRSETLFTAHVSNSESSFKLTTTLNVDDSHRSHGGGSHDINLSKIHGLPIPEHTPAPAEAAGDIGLDPKNLPDGLAVHFLGLTQAKWQTLIMMYSRDSTSKYAGIRICDIHHTLPIRSKTGIVWGPVWMKDEKSQRSLSCPAGFEKRIITVLNEDVLCECTLQGRKFDVSTFSRLENMGYDQFSP